MSKSNVWGSQKTSHTCPRLQTGAQLGTLPSESLPRGKNKLTKKKKQNLYNLHKTRKKLIPFLPGSHLTPQLAGSSVLFTTCKHERVKKNLAQTLLCDELAASLSSLLACCQDAAAPSAVIPSTLTVAYCCWGRELLAYAVSIQAAKHMKRKLLILFSYCLRRTEHQLWYCWVRL